MVCCGVDIKTTYLPSIYYSAIENIQDIVASIQHETGINLETDVNDLLIDVRLSLFYLTDAIREGLKNKFDPRKVLRASKYFLYLHVHHI